MSSRVHAKNILAQNQSCVGMTHRWSVKEKSQLLAQYKKVSLQYPDQELKIVYLAGWAFRQKHPSIHPGEISHRLEQLIADQQQQVHGGMNVATRVDVVANASSLCRQGAIETEGASSKDEDSGICSERTTTNTTPVDNLLEDEKLGNGPYFTVQAEGVQEDDSKLLINVSNRNRLEELEAWLGNKEPGSKSCF